jgi:homoserine kinase type II
MDDTDSLLLRTNLTLGFDQLLKRVQENYPAIGRVLSYQPMHEGYDNANFKLKTTTGVYLLKVFSRNYTVRNVEDNVMVHNTLLKAGVPVPEVITGETGQLFLVEDMGKHKVFLIVTGFFEGESLEHSGVDLRDIQIVSNYLLTINSLDLEIAENYDAWGARNLLTEFEKKKQFLDFSSLKLVEAVVERFKTIDFEVLPKSLIHGDLQRKHVLKNTNHAYMLIDFGCINFDARVLDSAIFLANFCFDPKNWEKRTAILEIIRIQCFEPMHFNDAEIRVLPELVRAAYALHLLNCLYLESVHNDKSLQTQNWRNFSSQMLELSGNWELNNGRK